MRLKDRIAIVTGGGSGIGAATAADFAREGAAVVVADRREPAAQEVARAIEKDGGRALAVKVDITRTGEVAAMVRAAVEAFGRVDILVAAAGTGAFRPFWEITAEEWEKTINLLLNGTFYTAQAVTRQLISQGTGGKIILVASSGAEFPTNQLSAYCTAKAAVKMLGRSMALELGNFRINVNVIEPNVIHTRMTDPMLSEDKWRNMLRAVTPIGRWGEADEVGKLATFLASSDSDYINGQGIVICGGSTLPLAFSWYPLDYTEAQTVDWERPHRLHPYVRAEASNGQEGQA
jgi:NAD(P)-dependent dehydrogenase (short-subunit alcohol dehydrogenase family)